MSFTVVIPGMRPRHFKYFASANAFFKQGSYGTVMRGRNNGRFITKQASLPLH